MSPQAKPPTVHTWHASFSGEKAPTGVLIRLRAAAAYPAIILASAAFSATVLTIGLFQLEFVNENVDAAVTLLLAGPTLFGALVASPKRAAPGAQLIVGARSVLAMSSILTFLAAGALVALPYGGSQRLTWEIFTWIAWIVVLPLLLALVRPCIRR